MPIAAYLSNASDRSVIAANQAFCELIGFTEQELKELSWPRMLMPDYAAAAAGLLQTNTKTDGAIEWHFQKKDGSPLKVHGKYRLTQVVDANHKVHELYFTVVTPIK